MRPNFGFWENEREINYWILVSYLSFVVPRTGLEPARLAALAPETSASTIPPPGLAFLQPQWDISKFSEESNISMSQSKYPQKSIPVVGGITFLILDGFQSNLGFIPQIIKGFSPKTPRFLLLRKICYANLSIVVCWGKVKYFF